jgi:hypothetical protein
VRSTVREMNAMTSDSSRKPIVELTERWNSPLDAGTAADAIAGLFAKSSAKVERADSTIRIRTGSNWRYRFLGNSMSSSKTLPVALDVTVTGESVGSTVTAHAYDTFGFRLVGQSFFGAKESFHVRLEELLGSAAAAAKVTDREVGPA